MGGATGNTRPADADGADLGSCHVTFQVCRLSATVAVRPVLTVAASRLLMDIIGEDKERHGSRSHLDCNPKHVNQYLALHNRRILPRTRSLYLPLSTRINVVLASGRVITTGFTLKSPSSQLYSTL